MFGVEILSILAIAVGLSADCFAVALGGSVSGKACSKAGVLRASVSFGLFQAGMPVLGWLLGRTAVGLIGAYDHLVAFALLAFVGGRMLRASLQRDKGEAGKTDITRGLPLLVLSVATSIDALAVGLTFALLETNIALASATIGAIAFAGTVAGFMLGARSGKLVGKRAELVGGIILIAIGLRILLSHIV